MTPEEIAQVRPRLLEFAGSMLAGALPRKDQRAKGELYLRGLLTDGRRRSMQPMAERLGVDHQGLQQFITSSTLMRLGEGGSGTLLLIDGGRSGGEQDPLAEQVEAGPAEHGALEHLDLVDVTLDRAGCVEVGGSWSGAR